MKITLNELKQIIRQEILREAVKTRQELLEDFQKILWKEFRPSGDKKISVVLFKTPTKTGDIFYILIDIAETEGSYLCVNLSGKPKIELNDSVDIEGIDLIPPPLFIGKDQTEFPCRENVALSYDGLLGGGYKLSDFDLQNIVSLCARHLERKNLITPQKIKYWSANTLNDFKKWKRYDVVKNYVTYQGADYINNALNFLGTSELLELFRDKPKNTDSNDILLKLIKKLEDKNKTKKLDEKILDALSTMKEKQSQATFAKHLNIIGIYLHEQKMI